MKKQLFTIVLISLATLITSCAKEDLSERINDVVLEKENGESIANNKENSKSPIAVADLSPCGYGFYVNIDLMGVPSLEAYPYTISISGTSTVVDSGTISNGSNTNWVLSPCTEYDFEFWGSEACSSCSTIQTLTTDGCGGVFIC